MTEGRIIGFKKILDALETNGSPKPEFETDDDYSYFITRLYIHEPFLKENELKKREKRSQKGAKKGAERKQAILELLEQNSTVPQIMFMAETPGLSTGGVKYHIEKLKNEGLIERIGADRGGYWRVR